MQIRVHKLLPREFGLGLNIPGVTLESNLPIKYTLSLQSSPDQIVLDLENTGLNPPLGSLPTKIDAKDPLIKKAHIEYLSSNGFG